MNWDEPHAVIEAANRVLPPRLQHEFGLWCAEKITHLLEDQNSRRALGVKRRWLDGKASNGELAEAQAAAFNSPREDAKDIAKDIAWYATCNDDWVAANFLIATDVATIADDGYEAERKRQADWLIKNYRQQIHEGLVAEAFDLL